VTLVHQLVPLIVVIALIVLFVRLRGRSKLPLGTPSAKVDYLGGHPAIWGRHVRMARIGDTIELRCASTRTEIPIANIVGIQFNEQWQVVNTGGGLSVGGAVAGALLFGPVGAIVGGQKRTKLQSFNRSSIRLRVRSDSGVEYDILFGGGLRGYERIAGLLS
jgi:hypothetical protein